MPTCARVSGVATTAGGLTDPRRARMGLSSLRRTPLRRRHRPPHVRCFVEPIGAAAHITAQALGRGSSVQLVS